MGVNVREALDSLVFGRAPAPVSATQIPDGSLHDLSTLEGTSRQKQDQRGANREHGREHKREGGIRGGRKKHGRDGVKEEEEIKEASEDIVVDVAGSRKLRKLGLVGRDCTKSERPFLKRYVTKADYEKLVVSRLRTEDHQYDENRKIDAAGGRNTKDEHDEGAVGGVGGGGGGGWLSALRSKAEAIAERTGDENVSLAMDTDLLAGSGVAGVNGVRRRVDRSTANLKSLGDLNGYNPHQSRVTAVGFLNPNPDLPTASQYLYSAGVDGVVKIYSVPVKKPSAHECLASLKLEKLPIHSAAVAGNRLYCLSDRSALFALDPETQSTTKLNVSRSKAAHFTQIKTAPRILGSSYGSSNPDLLYCLDECGRLHLVDARFGSTAITWNTGTRITAFTSMTASQLTETETEAIASLSISANAQPRLLAGDANGNVFCFEQGCSRPVCPRTQLEAAPKIASLALSGPNLLVGCSDGLINLHSLSTLAMSHGRSGVSGESGKQASQTAGILAEKPFKVISNLKGHSLSILAAAGSKAIAVAGSSKAQDHLRLLNLEDRVVFQRWPTQRARIHRPSTVAISDDHLAIGSLRGFVQLWRIPSDIL